ncbi:MAG TPA: acetylornithine transaminase [Acidimicrobiia bacterium]|jgi:predicted acetylornithine/succinylornithine family transaminase
MSDVSFEQLVALDAEHVMQTYARLPIAFVRGDGTKLWDTDGKEYLDFLAGLAVVSLGHANPEVAEAIATQASTLVHVSNLYYNERQPQLAAVIDGLLTEATGAPGKVFFTNSGAEANECAIKVARRYGQANGGRERFHVVSAYNSFHGRTLTTLAATGQPQKQETFQPLPEGFRQVAFGDLDALAAALDGRACAVMLEPIQGEGGVEPAPPGYLEAVRALCDEREVLLLVDEVQTGLARTGRWFGFEHGGDVRPDVVTMAKALGNGIPIGACWARRDVADALQAGDHGSTFGGQPLAAAAALKTLEIMQRDDLVRRAHEKGEDLAKRLGAVDGIEAVRGAGLLLGAELRPASDSRAVMLACLDRGLVVNAVTPTALRLAPPLLVTDDEIEQAVAIVEEVLAS